jgi:cold shock CspA family protein
MTGVIKFFQGQFGYIAYESAEGEPRDLWFDPSVVQNPQDGTLKRGQCVEFYWKMSTNRDGLACRAASFVKLI